MSDNQDFTFDFTSFLPGVNQTPTLQKFFGATVNQLFQPGVSKTISGYIGQVPQYNNYLTDFYVQEPDAERGAYQLEPSMVSFDQSAISAPTVSYALTYPDFVSYLLTSGANTSYEPRLFENKYYSWAPPIDIDKILNFSQYTWVGSPNNGDMSNPYSVPAVKLSSPITMTIATAGQTSFPTCGLVSRAGQPLGVAYVNGNPVSGTYANNTFTLNSPTNAGDTVVVVLQDALGNALLNASSFDLSAFASYYVEYQGNSFTKSFNAFQNPTVSGNLIVNAVYVNGVLAGYDNGTFTYVGGQNSNFSIDTTSNPVVTFDIAPRASTANTAADVITIVTYNGLDALINQTPPTTLDTSGIAISVPSFTSGLAITLQQCKFYYASGHFSTLFCDNVGVATRFTNVTNMVYVSSPQYQTIDRSSIDENAWSLHNFWVHSDSYAWSGNSVVGTKATRPIIEFIKDIIPFNYGNSRIEVDAIMTKTTASYSSNGQVSQITLAQINGMQFGSVAVDNGSVFTPNSFSVSESGNLTDTVSIHQDVSETGNATDTSYILSSTGKLLGGSIVETEISKDYTDISRGLNGYVLRNGTTLLVINEFVNQLFSVVSNNGVISLVPLDAVEGQYFTTSEFSVFGGQDIHFDETTSSWIVGGTQEWNESVAPLFNLYNADSVGVLLNDASMYTGSNFSGSKILSYAKGTGVTDTVLLQPLQYDSNGYIVFSNDTVNERYAYNGGSITGLYCYGVYSIQNNTSVTEFGSLQDQTDSFISNSMQQSIHGQQHIDVVSSATVSESGALGDSVNAILGPYVLEQMSASDYVNVASVSLADSSSISYVTYSLWLPAKTPSQQTVGSSFAGIPPNLQANPLAADVSYISLSDWYLHFTEILENQNGFSGSTFSSNNYRDTAKDLTLGTEIVQHQSPMLKSMLVSSTEIFDVPAAIYFVENEYKKFKNKFALKIVDLSNRGVLDNGITDNTSNPNDPVNWATSPVTWAITALNQIKSSYNSSFPFSLSTMGGGNYFIPPTPAFLGIMPSTSPMFIIDTTYSRQQCYIRGHDGSYLPAFGTFTLTNDGYISSDWRDHVFLALETLIYQNIPSLLANTGNLANYIQERLNFDVSQWTDNAFYTNPLSYGYSKTEVDSILISSFEQWTQQGKFDYRTYGGYDQTNPFTWNYNGTLDRFGNPLPGNWRAIYNLYFDTDHPHTRPWEMLGFADIPNWWVGVYGTDWSRANTALWNDLKNGFVAEGPRFGINPRYARPGLMDVIPVDAYGNLLDPVAAKIVPLSPTQFNATRDWVFGDWGPVETQWRNSSSYKFALANLGFLIKPPQFMEIGWDTSNYGFSGSQWVNTNSSSSDYLNRPSSASDLVHGEIDDAGNPTVVIGIQQWIVDGLVNSGKPASLLGNAVRSLDVRLTHRMAGFVSSDGLKVISDTFGLMPSEDVQIALYNSPAFDTESYTGVIVEYTGNGYRIVGYDKKNQYFTILPPITSSQKGTIAIGSNVGPAPMVWRPSTFYVLNVKITYNGYVYECIKSHTSTNVFDVGFWTPLGKQPPVSPRVVSYASYSQTPAYIPYSTVLPNLQAVSDFLLGLQAWQVSRGWVFSQIDANTGLTKNWALSVREFLEWSQVSWAPGNFISLSPGAENLVFVSTYGTVLNVEDSVTGFFGLLDRSGNPISSRSAFITRNGSQITLQANNADIYGATLRLAETEHLLVMSNTTIFDNILYVPLFNLRQARLKLIANVSTNWNGRMSAPGFVLTSTGLVPNFSKNAEDIRTMFDIEKTDRTDFLSYARHNIGYQARSYMEDLLLSDTEQFEFFQGMIQAKGSPSVFERLLRSTRINENSDIEFLEEWAVRQSHYGAPFNPRITLTLPQNDVRSDPQLIVFENITNGLPTWIEIPTSPLDSRWLDAPDTQNFFPPNVAGPVLPSAGPVRLSEVQYTSFTVDDLQQVSVDAYNNNLSVFNTGERVWIYNNNGSWDVWRVFDIGYNPNPITQIVVPSDNPAVNGMRIYFQNPLTISENDIGRTLVINGSTMSMPDLIGTQTITDFDYAGQWIEVNQQGVTGYIFTGSTVAPVARIFRSVRFADTTSLNSSIVYSVFENANALDYTDQFDINGSYTVENGNLSDSTMILSSLDESYWKVGDIVWVDNDSGTNLYAVRVWDGSNFNVIRNQPSRVDPGSITNSTIYEANSQIVNSATQIAQLISDQPLLSNLTIIDPLAGFVSGLAEREITYRSDIDPARYNASLNPWNASQVGQVWWDLSTCRYLDPYTDMLGINNERDVAEISYRSQNWATIAPNTSIDIYEWVESSVSPQEWSTLSTTDTTGTYSGDVYDITAFSQNVVFNPQYGVFSTVYYFWVKNRTITPNVPFRNTNISTVASLLTNPSATGTPWIAPIMPNGLLVSGVQSSLDNISSALSVEITNGSDQQIHAEWILLDQNDSLSIPPEWLLRKMRDSLGGFVQNLSLLPNPSLSSYRSTGIYDGQNMFSDKTPARQSYVGIINNIFARNPLTSINASGVAALNLSDNSVSLANPYLCWSRANTYDPIIPPPSNEYSVVVHSSDERNRLILNTQFQTALQQNGNSINVLVDGTNTANPFWSVWTFDPAAVNLLLRSKPFESDEISFLYENAEQVFSLALSYDASATSYENMVKGTVVGTVSAGSKIFVQSDETADGFWTIYIYDGQNYIIHRSQLFRTNDFINVVDWYAQDISIGGNVLSFSASMPPTVSYGSTSLRDRNEGTTNFYSLPQNLFVSVTDSVSNEFSWYQFDTTIAGTTTVNGVSTSIYTGWTLVASSGGTIALSDAFFTNATVGSNTFARFVFGLTNPPVLSAAVNGVQLSTITNRDGSWEIKVLFDLINALVLNGAEINEAFFSMIHFIHTQQNSVDWIFKTSFMTVGGFAIPLKQTGILLDDPTSDLIDYINEVKPYRVKIRSYSQQYTLGTDSCTVGATDFDLPVYLDSNGNYQSVYSTVVFENNVPTATFVDNNGNPTGVPAILSEAPYEDWYNNFLTSENVRSITIKIAFDRVSAAYSGYAVPPYSTAGYDYGNSYSTVYAAWVGGNNYVVGNDVNYNGYNYTCSTSNNSPVFVSTEWTLLDSALINETSAYRIANYYDGTAINNVLSYSYGNPDPLNVRQKGNEIDGNENEGSDFNSEFDSDDGFDGADITGYTSDVDGGSLAGTTPYTSSINGPTTDANRAISDTQTVILPNNTSATIPLGGIADPWGYGLRDARLDANVPEEYLPLIMDDTVAISVMSRSVPGAPIQSAKVYDIASLVSSKPQNFQIDVVPESNQAVLVFRDGLLGINGTDYIVDQLGRTALVNVVSGSTKFNRIHIHGFGVGATKTVNGQFLLSAPSSAPSIYELNVSTPISNNQLGVTVSGARTTNFTIGSDHTSIVFNPAPSAGADIFINQYTTNATNEACNINVQTLTYNSQQSWQLAYNDTSYQQYAGTLVFVNGARLMPPLTYYGTFTSSSSEITMDVAPTSSYLVYWIQQGNPWLPNTAYSVGNIVSYEGTNYSCTTANTSNQFIVSEWALEKPTLYANQIPTISTLSQTGGAINNPQFAFLGNQLVSQNSNFVSPYVSIVLLTQNDYTLSGSQLTISKTLSAGENIQVINFTNSFLQQPQTYTYAIRNNGEYPLINLPPTSDYSIVSYNGLTLCPDADYQFTLDANNNPMMVAPSLTSGSGYVVITIYPGAVYRGEMSYLTSTTTPSPTRMSPKLWSELSEAEQGSTLSTFSFSGNFTDYLSFVNLNNNVPNANSVYSISIAGTPYTTPVPILTSLPNPKTDGLVNDPQFAFFGSSLISQNFNYIEQDTVTVTLSNIPVPIFANLDNWAALIPYDPQDSDPYANAIKNKNGVPQPQIVFDMVDWNNIPANNIRNATLANDILITDQTASLSLNQGNFSPKLGSPSPLHAPTVNSPGVIWVNGERIEYSGLQYGGYVSVTIPAWVSGTNYNVGDKVVYNDFNYECVSVNNQTNFLSGNWMELENYDAVPTTATLTGLRRSTNGTTIPENRVIVTSPYPVVSPQSVFVINTASANLAQNGVVQVYTQDGGKNSIVSPTQYTLSRTTNQVTVTITNITDAFYVVSLTIPLSHSTGSKVYNGNANLESVPAGPYSGNRYQKSIKYMTNDW